MPKGLKRPRDPGGIKGGEARATALTAARRTEIAQAGAQARWGKRGHAAGDDIATASE